MSFEKFDIMEFEDSKRYIVIDIVDFNNNKYLYLANENDSTDYIIVKEVTINSETMYDQIYDEEFLSVAKIISDKNKDLLNGILNEKESE